MLQLSNFDSARIGSGYPTCIDIDLIQYHEQYGLIAKAYLYSGSDNKPRKVEIRKKGDIIALITYGFLEMSIPDGWIESQLIWSYIID